MPVETTEGEEVAGDTEFTEATGTKEASTAPPVSVKGAGTGSTLGDGLHRTDNDGNG
ncbi:hypothetical protein RvY_06144 [Ramazzottius varieornatus]|uniref:Uncharacterized protein n=1 Tax=Ramazzottius varieornatus TaxID=947166 RepID=A0A1D1V129_RAMVA|nr:hypothetical protein RvY_06144 [Ramazzottius varieornatus]